MPDLSRRRDRGLSASTIQEIGCILEKVPALWTVLIYSLTCPLDQCCAIGRIRARILSGVTLARDRSEYFEWIRMFNARYIFNDTETSSFYLFADTRYSEYLQSLLSFRVCFADTGANKRGTVKFCAIVAQGGKEIIFYPDRFHRVQFPSYLVA